MQKRTDHAAVHSTAWHRTKVTAQHNVVIQPTAQAVTSATTAQPPHRHKAKPAYSKRLWLVATSRPAKTVPAPRARTYCQCTTGETYHWHCFWLWPWRGSAESAGAWKRTPSGPSQDRRGNVPAYKPQTDNCEKKNKNYMSLRAAAMRRGTN